MRPGDSGPMILGMFIGIGFILGAEFILYPDLFMQMWFPQPAAMIRPAPMATPMVARF